MKKNILLTYSHWALLAISVLFFLGFDIDFIFFFRVFPASLMITSSVLTVINVHRVYKSIKAKKISEALLFLGLTLFTAIYALVSLMTFSFTYATV